MIAFVNGISAIQRGAWKILDLNRIWICDVAMPAQRSNQLNYEATDGEPTNYQLAIISGFIAQLVVVSHQHREVTDTNTV